MHHYRFRLLASLVAGFFICITSTAATNSTGQIEMSVETQNVIEPIAPINFGTLTSAALSSSAQVGTTSLSIYTTALEAPAGGLNLDVNFDKFDTTATKPYLWIGGAGETPVSPLYYDAAIYSCNGGSSKISLTQGQGVQNPSVTLTDNILSRHCTAPSGSPGKLEITVNQYDNTTRPPIVGGTYLGEIQMTVAPAGG